MKLKKKFLPIAYKLANLIDEKQKTIVLGLIVEILTDFTTENLGGQRNFTALDVFVDGVIRE